MFLNPLCKADSLSLFFVFLKKLGFVIEVYARVFVHQKYQLANGLHFQIRKSNCLNLACMDFDGFLINLINLVRSEHEEKDDQFRFYLALFEDL